VRTDSTSNLHRVLAGANIEIAPPAHVPLSAADWPYWHSIIEEFASADWTSHGLEMAALLARTMAMLEQQQRHLGAEGVVIERSDGSFGPNPRNRSVASLSTQVLALRRSLGLTARAKAGSSRDAARLRDANRTTERGAAGHNDLLS
jgi:phage terminase small subunit